MKGFSSGEDFLVHFMVLKGGHFGKNSGKMRGGSKQGDCTRYGFQEGVSELYVTKRGGLS